MENRPYKQKITQKQYIMYETSYRDQFTTTVILKTINWFRSVRSLCHIVCVLFRHFFLFLSLSFRFPFYSDCSCSFNTHQTWFVYWNWYMWKMVPYSLSISFSRFNWSGYWISFFAQYVRYILFSFVGSLSRVTHLINPATVVFFAIYFAHKLQIAIKKQQSTKEKKSETI